MTKSKNLAPIAVETKKRCWYAAALIVALAVVLSFASAGWCADEAAGAAPGTATDTNKPVITIGKDNQITLKQLDAVWQNEIPDASKQQITKMPNWQQRFLDEWTRMAVLAEMAKQKGMDKSEDFQIRMYSQETQILATQYVKQFVFPELDKIKAGPEEVDAYYNQHKEEFFNGWREVSQIVLKSEEDANKLYAQLEKKPADFEKLAKEKSIDENTKSKGGSLGRAEKGDGKLLPEVEPTVFNTAKGKLSKPVQSRMGWHIFLVKDASATDYMALDDNLRKQITPSVESDKKAQAFDKLVEDFKKQIGITIDPTMVPKVGEEWMKEQQQKGGGEAPPAPVPGQQ